MVNYRLEDLHALVKVLKEERCNVLEKIDESEDGFAWVIDPEGNKVELWQPPQRPMITSSVTAANRGP
jgi:hypothetical protein